MIELSQSREVMMRHCLEKRGEGMGSYKSTVKYSAGYD